MRIHYITLFISLLLAIDSIGQIFLRVTYENFGNVKSFEAYEGETIGIKQKGDLFYKNVKIVNILDSAFVVNDTCLIKFKHLKAIKLNRNIHIVKTLSAFFLIGGTGLFALDTTNNILTGKDLIINERAIYMALPLIAAGAIVKQLNYKRIKLSKRKLLKTYNLNYNKLS